MSAGLPGLGLGGLFFIFSALLAPFPELWRTLRGRSDRTAWRAIGRQLAQALAMVAAIDLTLRLTYVVLSAAGIGDPPAADEATALPLNLIGITTALPIVVICSAKLFERALRVRGGRLPRVPAALPRVAPLRAIALAAVAVVAWIALLTAGASQLSPLQRPPREHIASRPEQSQGRGLQEAALVPAATAAEATSSSGFGRGASGTPSGGGAQGDGGRAGITSSPDVAQPERSPPEPPQFADAAPAAGSQPKSPHVAAPAHAP